MVENRSVLKEKLSELFLKGFTCKKDFIKTMEERIENTSSPHKRCYLNPDCSLGICFYNLDDEKWFKKNFKSLVAVKPDLDYFNSSLNFCYFDANIIKKALDLNSNYEAERIGVQMRKEYPMTITLYKESDIPFVDIIIAPYG